MTKTIFIRRVQDFYKKHSSLVAMSEHDIERMIQEAEDRHVGDCITYEDDNYVIFNLYYSLCISETDSKDGTPIFLNFSETNLGFKYNHGDMEKCIVVNYTII